MKVQSGTAAGDAAASSPFGGRGFSLAVLTGALGMDVSGVAVLNSALPKIGEHFEIANSALQWTVTSYAVAFAGFLLFGGRAADVLGRRLIFTVGVVLFTAGALIGAVAPTMEMLIVGRVVQGIGAALSGPAALALLTQIFAPGAEQNKAFSAYVAVGAVSFSGGVVLGGVLTGLLGWRSVLAFSAVVGLLVLAGIRSALPPSVRHPNPLDLLGAVLVTGGLILGVFGVTHGGEAGWSDVGTDIALAAAMVLLAAFFIWERRVQEPLLPMSIFRSVPVRIASFTGITYYAAAFVLLFFAPLYMQGVLGYSPWQSGLALLPASITLFLTATFLTNRMLTRWGARPVMALGLGLIGVSMVWWAFVPVHGSYSAVLLPSYIITGMGQGLTFAGMTVAALTGVPQRQHGVAGAVNVTAQQIGSSIGVAALVVIGTAETTPGLSGTVAGYHAAFWTAAGLCALGVVVLAVTRRGWDVETVYDEEPQQQEAEREASPANPA